MNLRKHIRNDKKGSYYSEAALTLPLFILSVVALALIIVIITVSENIGFILARTTHEIDMEASLIRAPILVENRIKTQELKENPRITEFKVTDMDYLFTDRKILIDDLIYIRTGTNFTVENPIGICGKIYLDLPLMSRGFTGANRRNGGLDESVFEEYSGSSIVVIFPKYGIRYHTPNCWYVNKEYRGEEVKLKMEKEDAKLKGYTPCKVCGGGD